MAEAERETLAFFFHRGLPSSIIASIGPSTKSGQFHNYRFPFVRARGA
jgi:hypothetical protein